MTTTFRDAQADIADFQIFRFNNANFELSRSDSRQYLYRLLYRTPTDNPRVCVWNIMSWSALDGAFEGPGRFCLSITIRKLFSIRRRCND